MCDATRWSSGCELKSLRELRIVDSNSFIFRDRASDLPETAHWPVAELGLEPTSADSSSLLLILGEKEGLQDIDLVPSAGRVE